MDSVSEQDSTLSQSNLDDEFRNILIALKPFILSINNNDYLTQIRLWLEKLSGTESNEKLERNKYMIEFASQIRTGILKIPFTQIPPVGNLLPLSAMPSDEESVSSYGHQEHMIWHLHKDCFDNPPLPFNNDPLSNSWPQLPMTQYYMSPQTPRSDQNFTGQKINSPQIQNCRGYYSYYYPPPQGMRLGMNQRNCRRIKRRPSSLSRCYRRTPILNESPNENYCLQQFLEEPVLEEKAEKEHMTINEEPKLNLDCNNNNNNNNNTMVCEGPQQNVQETENKQLTEQSLEEDSSWCDLTDASMTSVSLMASGDADKKVIQQQEAQVVKDDKMKEYENRINNMMDKIQGLQQKNDELNQHVEECKKRHNWKKNWNILQVRFAETIQQNSELNLVIRKLEKKLNEVEGSKSEEKNEFKKRINELHNKEIEMLKQLQIENLRNIDTAHKRKLEILEHNYQKRIEELQVHYETKINDMRESHEKELKEREAEIERLDSIAMQQCVRISAEVSSLKCQIEGSNISSSSNTEERVVFLHKCISKMDKLFRKSEREYIRQIEKLKQEIEMKEKSVQIQLRTQKAELLAIATEEKQAYLDSVIQELEDRYIRLLQTQEKQAYEAKKKDEQIIVDLKESLEQNGISYST